MIVLRVEAFARCCRNPGPLYTCLLVLALPILVGLPVCITSKKSQSDPWPPAIPRASLAQVEEGCTFVYVPVANSILRHRIDPTICLLAGIWGCLPVNLRPAPTPQP